MLNGQQSQIKMRYPFEEYVKRAKDFVVGEQKDEGGAQGEAHQHQKKQENGYSAVKYQKKEENGYSVMRPIRCS